MLIYVKKFNLPLTNKKKKEFIKLHFLFDVVLYLVVGTMLI